MGADYTCKNCSNRYILDCDRYSDFLCDDFELDESTISEKEQMLLRVMRHVVREYKSNK